MAKKLVLYQGPTPVQVEGFPDDAQRSVPGKGSLHFIPRQTKEVTADEYAYLMAQRPDLKQHLVHLRDVAD
jgi:hypothetical protein